MTWTPLEKLSDIIAANGMPIRVPGDSLLNTFDDVLLEVGQTVHFSTARIDQAARGMVLALDHGSRYPVTLQYDVPGWGRRIENFSPAEFRYLKVTP